jgi:hypothetical protein
MSFTSPAFALLRAARALTEPQTPLPARPKHVESMTHASASLHDTASNHLNHEVKTVTPSQEAQPLKGVTESHTPTDLAGVSPVLSSPDEVNAIHPTSRDAAKEDVPARPDWATLGSQPGHCGSCARWEDAPDWGPLMGECMAGRRAHGWPDGNPSAPVVIHLGHRCAAHDGTAYRSKTGGKRGGPRLPPAGPAAQVAP